MQLPPFKLESYFEKYEFITRYLFGSSDAETYALQDLIEMSDSETRLLWKNLSLGYTETHGSLLIRQEINTLYETTQPENVLVCTGAEEGIYATMQTLLEPGSHVILITPCYQSLKTLPLSLGAQLTEIPLNAKPHWQLDINLLENAVRTNTRLIIINFPHNPTSYLPDKNLFIKIIELAKQAGAYLFSDEVYRFSEQDKKHLLPAACDHYENAISLGVMSKSFGLAGLRIGWLASKNTEIIEKIASFKNYLSICNSAPSELLTIMALRAKEKIISRNLKIIHHNLHLLDNFFSKYEKLFEWQRPIAGMTAFPRLKHSMSIDQFSDQLIKAKGVMILPGSVYDYPGNYFRLGFGRRNLPEALSLFESFIKDLSNYSPCSEERPSASQS